MSGPTGLWKQLGMWQCLPACLPAQLQQHSAPCMPSCTCTHPVLTLPALLPVPCSNARTHYFRWRNIGWIIQYALQHNLIDAAHGSAAAWTFENPSAIQGSYAYWSTVLDVQGAEIGTSTTIATDCNVDPLRPDAARPDAARLPAPKVLTPHITGAPPAILSKPALSRPAFLQMAHAASVNAQTMLAQGKLVLSV